VRACENYLGFLCRIEALHAFADLTEGDDLAVAIVKRLDAIAEEIMQLMGKSLE